MRKRDASKVKVGDAVRYSRWPGPQRKVVEVITESSDPRDKLPLFVLDSAEVITYALVEKVEA